MIITASKAKGADPSTARMCVVAHPGPGALSQDEGAVFDFEHGVRTVDLDRGNPLAVKQKDWLTSFSSCGYETRYHIKEWLYSKRSD